jgi:protein TonB
LPKFGEYVYVEELPEAITKVPPSYPDLAREANVDGTVMVQALVGKDGKVKDTKVVKSIPMLNDAALAAVKQWVFKPALSNNKPVAVWVAVPVKFSLHGP